MRMAKKASKQTKSKIVSAAWRLFYEQGYDNTTVDEIIAASGTSKGSFYHYFDGKDALLGTLADLFDEAYETLSETIDPTMHSIDVLCYLNRELFGMIENRVDIDLLTRLYATQLTTKGDKRLLDHNRVAAAQDRSARTGKGRTDDGKERQRHRPPLRDGGAGAAVRLVSLRRRLLAADLCRGSDADVSFCAAREVSAQCAVHSAQISQQSSVISRQRKNALRGAFL